LQGKSKKMKKIILSILSFVVISGAAVAQTEPSYYGAKIDDADAKPVTEIPALLKDKKEVTDLKVAGTINGVCQAKGCWMTMTVAEGQEMTVKFKDYAFFMPKDCSGKKAVLLGKVSRKVVSVAELKHLAEDAGKSKAEIKKITKPKEEYSFEASGVILMNA
jgi:hypothetical protein